MDYPLARLGPREFEHLLQSLCQARFGLRVEVYGDGPDGGRDGVIKGAIRWSEDGDDDVWDGYTVMQAKFRQRCLGPALDATWLLEKIREELEGWLARPSRRRPDYLLFATNVVLTPAPGGGIEKVNALMAQYGARLGGLKGWRVWHHDDICRLLDREPGIRGAYGLASPGEVAQEIAARVVELQKKSIGSGLLDGFPGLAGVDAAAVPAYERALTGVLALHREACARNGEGDPWLLPAFAETVLRHMLGPLREIYLAPPGQAQPVTPAERLLLHVIPVYIDAVLRLEQSSRLTELRNENSDAVDRVARADLERAFAAAPTIAGRLRNAAAVDERPEPGVDVLQRWIAHQATMRSPSVWDDRAARSLARTLAALLDERAGAPQQELADLIGRIGRHAAYDAADFDDSPRALRLPQCPLPLEIRPAAVAWFSRFFWQAALDPRTVGRRVAEQVGLRVMFDLDQAVSDLRAAQWMTTDTGIDIDAVCSHPATAQALVDHAHRVDDEIRLLRHQARGIPVFGRLRADEQLIRPRTAGGVPLFQLPLTELSMSQDQVRQLLMGSALYGRPELAIREMYQNAMDACRRRAMRRRYLRTEGRGAAGPYHGTVTIRQRRLDDGKVCIECIDNGTGITREELRNAFAQAGRRFTDLASFQDEQAQWLKADAGLRLYPNSRFGIGVFSYFMLSNEFTVETVPEHPDGNQGQPLQVLVSAPSGLLTIRTLNDVPAEIAGGGTVVRLYLDDSSPTGQSASTVSVLSLLEELIGVTELHLVVEEDGYEPSEWRPLELGPVIGGPAKLAFESEGCRGWWTLSGGAVLVDGIRTDADLPGLLVDLRGAHAPRVRADRNSLLEWDQSWAIDQFIAAVDTVASWEEVTFQWLWQVSVAWPALGQRLFEVMRDRQPAVTVGLGLPRRARADVRTVGALPANLVKHSIHLESILRSPFSPPPGAGQYWREVSVDEYAIGWPIALNSWQWQAWSAGINDAEAAQSALSNVMRPAYPARLASIGGYPIPDPIDVAIMGRPHSVFHVADGFRGALDPIFLAAGAARSGVSLSEAVRRIRRFHIAGLLLAEVDARDLTDLVLDPVLLQVLARVIAMNGEDARYANFWVHTALITAYESRRPLTDIRQLLETLACVGLHEELTVGDAGDRPPTLAEVQFFCQGPNHLGGLADKLADARPRRAAEYMVMIERYLPLILSEFGLAADTFRSILLEDFTELERVAWSRQVDGDRPWIIGEDVDAVHFARVAAKCGINLREAQRLVLRCPGVRASESEQKELPAVDVPGDLERLIEPIYASHGPYARYKADLPRLNALIFSQLATSTGLDPASAARMLDDLPVRIIHVPDVDWNFVDNFRPDRLQQLLLQQKDDVFGSVHRLSATRIGIVELVSRAAEAAESLPALALSAHTLESLGVQLEFPEPVPDVVPDETDLTIAGAVSRDALLGLPGLLAELHRNGQTDLPSSLRRIAMWITWIWPHDHRLSAILAALPQFDGQSAAQLGQLATDAIAQMRRVSANGNLARPHLIEIAGTLGVPVSVLESAVAPFARFWELDAAPVPWFRDPVGTPPDWLDVAVVALLTARPDLSVRWNAELADFLTANVMAPQTDIRERYDRWREILMTDPNHNAILPAAAYPDRPPTGMLRWDA